MHSIEPFFNWRNHYIASEDERSPFYEREYSEFEFTDRIYDHLIHPQWDNIDSNTIYIKILFTEYEQGYAIIEMFGEWNDCLYNDIMTFKRNVVDILLSEGVNKFILIAENVLNFHGSDDSYYEEWFEDTEDGWIAILNLRQHVLDEFIDTGIDQYFLLGGNLMEVSWRTAQPIQLCEKINGYVQKRLQPSL